MKRLVLLPLLIAHAAWGQSLTMPATGDTTLTLQPGSTLTLLDPGGSANYPDNSDATVTILSPATAITVSGNFHTEYNTDFVYLYDGTSSEASQLGYYSGLSVLSATAYSGALTVRFTSNITFALSGFSLTISACSDPIDSIGQVAVSDITDSSATLTWSDSSATALWTIRYGTTPQALGQHLTVSQPSATLTGLSEHTRYYYRIYADSGDAEGPCTVRTRHFQTPCTTPPSACIDYSDLYSCYVTARYGTFHNSDTATGVVDYGSDNPLSRHTVHTDTAERDSRTGNQLRTIPVGHSSSVRLGNWQTGSQAESITYHYTVDTGEADLLLMRYAVVLQDPDHPASEQPRFTFRILDDDGEVIDASCLSATYVAGSALGWNSYTAGAGSGYGYSSVLWKDWSAIGFDLGALHGQTIHIKLTTYDCARQNHYGYAYFVFECNHKHIEVANCGASVENTFTAPEGFNYRWYRPEYEFVTLATNRSYHVTQAGDYRCDLSFVGNADSATCTFTLNANASQRFPTAILSLDSIGTDTCGHRLQLVSHSVISLDSTHTQLTSQPCDALLWRIDSTLTFSSDSVQLTLSPGWHSVQLTAMLAGGCSDSTTVSFHLSDPCFRQDTLAVTLCQGESYLLFDTLIADAGIYTRDSTHLRRTLMLTLLPNADSTLHDTIVQNALPYPVAGTLLYGSQPDTTYHLSAANGCDSTLHFNLHVWPNLCGSADSTLCQNSLPLTWNGHAFTIGDFNLQAAQPTATASVLFAASGPHGEDSTLTMQVTLLKNSAMTLHDTAVQNSLPVTIGGITFSAAQADTTWVIANAAGCDSTITYSLHVWPNVEAEADSTLCEGLLPITWNGITFTVDDTVTLNLATLGIYGCHGEDSTLTMRLHVLHNSSHTQQDTVVQNALPVTYGGHTFGGPVADTSWTLANAAGCDSTVYYTLHVWPNQQTVLDSTVCDDLLPLLWCGLTFETAGTQTLNLSTQHGADSTVTLTLIVHPTYTIFDTAIICQGDPLPYGCSGGDLVLDFSTLQGCDSTLHLHVIVHPSYAFYSADTICSNQSVTFDGTPLNTSGHYEAPHQTQQGCDSTLTLDLTVYPTSRTYDHAVVCDGGAYTWIDGNSYTHSTYEPTITYTDQHGCDSIHQLILDIDNEGFKASMELSPRLVTPNQPQVRLRDLSHSQRRTWYFGDSQDTARICTFAFPAGLDSLDILLVASNAMGCIDSVSDHVRCDRATFWAPNAFTPGEAQNNRFAIVSNDLTSGEVTLYNRAGLLVAHFDLLGGSWDGTHSGKPCPQGTYVWVMTYTTLTQPRQSQHAKGTVTLLR